VRASASGISARVGQSEAVVQLAMSKRPCIGRTSARPDPLHPVGPPFLSRSIPRKMLNSSP